MEEFRLISKDASGEIHGTEAGERLLRDLGLESLDDARRFEGGSLASAGRRRQVRRIEVGGEVVFLKLTALSLSWWQNLLTRIVPSEGRREAVNLRRLAELGIRGAEPLAFGGWGRRSCRGHTFLLTRCVPGVTLHDYLLGGGAAVSLPRDESNDVAVRSAVIDVLRRLGRAGVVWGQLMPKHLFVSREGGNVVVHVIDVLALARSGQSAEAHAMVALFHLAAHTPQWLVSLPDRMRFVREAYPELDARELMSGVGRGLDNRLRKRAAMRGCLLTRRPSDGQQHFERHSADTWTSSLHAEDPEDAGTRVDVVPERIRSHLNTYRNLREWVPCANVLGGGREAGRAWVTIRRPEGSIADHLDAVGLGAGELMAITDVLRAWILFGYLPENPLEALGVADGVIVSVPVGGVSFVRPTTEADARALVDRLRAGLAAVGHPTDHPFEQHAFTLPRLLGLRRPIVV